jgi:hypothetical protein
VNPIVAREVAAAHQATPRTGGPACGAAYARLVDETDRIFRLLTMGPMRLDIVVTMSERRCRRADPLGAARPRSGDHERGPRP